MASGLTPSSLAQRRRERPAQPSPGDGFSGTAAVSQGLGGCDGLDPSITLLSPHPYAPSLCPSGKSHPECDSYEAKGIQSCLTQKETDWISPHLHPFQVPFPQRSPPHPPSAWFLSCHFRGWAPGQLGTMANGTGAANCNTSSDCPPQDP